MLNALSMAGITPPFRAPTRLPAIVLRQQNILTPLLQTWTLNTDAYNTLAPSLRASINKAGDFTNTQKQSQSEAFGAGSVVTSGQACAFGQASVAGANGVAIGSGSNSYQGSDNVSVGKNAGTTASFTTPNGWIILGSGVNPLNTSQFTQAGQFVAGSSSFPMNNVWFGKGVSNATPTAYTIRGCGAISGTTTDGAGAAVNLAGGVNTGQGTGGSVNLQVSIPAAASANTDNASVTILAIEGTRGAVTITMPATLKALAATVEAPCVTLDSSAIWQWGTGTLTVQRSHIIKGQTLAFVAASTVTFYSTFDIQSAGTLGANCSGITDNYYLTCGGSAGSPVFGVKSTGALVVTTAVFSGGITVAGALLGVSDIRAGAGGQFYWTGRSSMGSTADGLITLFNQANTDFTRLNLGGTTSSFPALGRSTTYLVQQLADGTAGGGFKMTGLMVQYNNVTTTGWGVPAIYGAARATGQTAANASVATYTCGAADGTFRVAANVLVTTSSAESFTVTVSYTDEGNTSRTLTLNFSTIGGTLGSTIAFANGAVPYEGVPLMIRVKASTAITIKSAAGGTYTGCTYNIEGYIEQIA